MPTADILNLADAIVIELNGHAFSQQLTAKRGYLPTYELPDLNNLKVSVVPKEDEGKLDTRSSSSHEYAIDIGVQKKPPALTNNELDPLMLLTQEIADHFLFGQRPGGATLISPSVRILYLQEHLQKLRQFTSVITLTFRAWRAPS
ncbi:MAG: hypothetical protein RIC55_02495 [Pirellulaceae bacterium]